MEEQSISTSQMQQQKKGQDKRLPLVEMFGPTISGEGSAIGQQTYFLRFGLCDYKCTMCDSMNAVDPAQVKANATWYTQDELLETFLAFHKPGSSRWVTLSGGNPCIHDLTGLVQGLQRHGFHIAVETQGTFAPRWLTDCDLITVSPKGPGMGENTDLDILDAFLDEIDWHGTVSLKIVIFDQRDLEFAKMIYERYGAQVSDWFLSLGNPYPPGYMEADAPRYTEYVMAQIGRYKMLLEDIIYDPILSQFKFLPQFHTFLWGNDKGR